jgi:hypothetical protein
MHIDLVRDASDTMPEFADPSAIRSLRVWFCKYKSLGPIAMLSKLKVMVIAGFPEVNFELLAGLQDLEYLSILHFPKVSELSPIESLQRLKTLSLETLPSWDASGKVTEVNSLSPIAGLSSLQHLSLLGVVPKDRSLSPLVRCANLLSARFGKYPKSEVKRFYASTHLSDAHVPEPVFDSI